jgi:HAD superfamily phosphatase (TIGR01668 family)
VGIGKNLYPDAYVEDVFSIDYQGLFASGYRGIVFDIDQTLVPHGFDSTAEVDDLFRSLRAQGFQTLLLSNNSEERIQRFIRNIDTLYIHDAQKPKTGGYLKAVEMMGLSRSEVVFIGDQILRDIYGAKRSGLASILVRYLCAPGEEGAPIGVRRTIEARILKRYLSRRGPRQGWEGFDMREAVE